MGIASLVLGIIPIVTGWVPFICFIALILAIIGLILGIVDTIKKGKIPGAKKGVSIAGLIICAVAIPIIIFSSLVSFGIFAYVITEDYDSSYYNDWQDFDDYDYDDWYRYYYNTIDYNTYELL